MNYLNMSFNQLTDFIDQKIDVIEHLQEVKTITQNKLFDQSEEIKALKKQIEILNDQITKISENKIINFIDPNINK